MFVPYNSGPLCLIGHNCSKEYNHPLLCDKHVNILNLETRTAKVKEVNSEYKIKYYTPNMVVHDNEIFMAFPYKWDRANETFCLTNDIISIYNKLNQIKYITTEPRDKEQIIFNLLGIVADGMINDERMNMAIISKFITRYKSQQGSLVTSLIEASMKISAYAIKQNDSYYMIRGDKFPVLWQAFLFALECDTIIYDTSPNPLPVEVIYDALPATEVVRLRPSLLINCDTNQVEWFNVNELKFKPTSGSDENNIFVPVSINGVRFETNSTKPLEHRFSPNATLNLNKLYPKHICT